MEKPIFDLLKNKNDAFYVQFDIFTQRPHFIILPRDDTLIPRDFSMTENTKDITQEIIKTAQSMMVDYGIPDATLSIHRGSWFSKYSPRFHAHLCVDVDLYLKVFKQKENEVKDDPSWSKAKTTFDTYPDDVKGYTEKQREKHFEKEVKAVGKKPLLAPTQLPKVDQTIITQVLFHPSHPKIGFVGKSDESSESLERVFREIESFAKGLGLANLNSKDYDNGGCHVCLYLGGAGAEDWELDGQQEGEVLGCIVTSAPRFYQLSSDQETWFANFQKSYFACVT